MTASFISSVLRLPPHHLHPPVGGRNPGSCRRQHRKAGSDIVDLRASSVVRRIKCRVLQVKTWVKTKLEELSPISSQPQNVIDDVEKLQREVTTQTRNPLCTKNQLQQLVFKNPSTLFTHGLSRQSFGSNSPTPCGGNSCTKIHLLVLLKKPEPQLDPVRVEQGGLF